MRLNHCIMGCECLKFIRRGDEGQLGIGGHFIGKFLGKTDFGINAGADSGAALRQIIKFRQHGLNASYAVFHHGDIAGKLLPQSQRRGVLRVGASDFDDVLKCLGLFIQRIVKLLQTRHQQMHNLLRRRNMHRSRKGVI